MKKVKDWFTNIYLWIRSLVLFNIFAPDVEKAVLSFRSEEDLGGYNFHEAWGTYKADRLQAYQRDNVKVRNNRLELNPKKEEGIAWRYENGKRIAYKMHYTSGLVISKRDYSFGIFKVWATIPSFIGGCSAIWLFSADEGGIREIDIQENRITGKRQRRECMCTVHGGTDYGEGHEMVCQKVIVDRLSGKMRCYEIEWRRDKIVWRLDGEDIAVNHSLVPQKPMKLIMNLQIYEEPDVMQAMTIKGFEYTKI